MRSRLDVVRNNKQPWNNDFVAFGEAFIGLQDLEREFELLVYAFDKDIPFLDEMGNFLRHADQNSCTMGEEKDEEFFWQVPLLHRPLYRPFRTEVLIAIFSSSLNFFGISIFNAPK